MVLARRLLSPFGTGSFLPPEDLPLHGVRAAYYDGTIPFGQSISDSTFTPMKFNYVGPDIRCYDTNGYHPILTDANLTGTVSKTAGNVTITGSGTSFTTQLAVGYPVRIPGGSAHFYGDVVVVKTITDNTHFDCYVAPVLTASGQTAFKDSSVFIIPPGFDGYYAFSIMYAFRANTSGVREANLVFNGAEGGWNAGGSNSHFAEADFSDAASAGEVDRTFPGGPVYMTEGQYVQVVLYQSSGGTLSTASDLVGDPFSMWRCGTL